VPAQIVLDRGPDAFVVLIRMMRLCHGNLLFSSGQRSLAWKVPFSVRRFI
jgi:hypothetical protein